MELMFKGYRSFEAQPDDPLRLKWDAVRRSLAVPSITYKSISALNEDVNHRIFYLAELTGADVWQTPEQTWSLGNGDCEDFAILKYALLQPDTLARIVVGEIKSIAGNKPHAWCAFFDHGDWYALDSMFDQIIKVTDYINWLPMAAMWDEHVVRFGPEFTIADQLKEVA